MIIMTISGENVSILRWWDLRKLSRATGSSYIRTTLLYEGKISSNSFIYALYDLAVLLSSKL